ncbi:hypothetical protein [Paradevosia shaoguanensis]|uniref:Uncharacterized protein n=1 Tax=Paradevosia shaoguanensis TaxID=1335043 RepID=A0AA41QKP8_9HYPH|nr:hypothetical protein [Paradevosia shaoguanensis]MCF1741460.1 hypothetical protein [Paradevosia shaoguanensis]MCI0125943.1 hypothetical protein [Paradevosia shaoguanensis]
MALTLSASIYGFGSAFAGKGGARDIDILIVHQSSDPASCRLAIACKRRLAERLPLAHVTMLSAPEEEHLKFIETANAMSVGTLRNGHLEEDLNKAVAVIAELAAKGAEISPEDR